MERLFYISPSWFIGLILLPMVLSVTSDKVINRMAIRADQFTIRPLIVFWISVFMVEFKDSNFFVPSTAHACSMFIKQRIFDSARRSILKWIISPSRDRIVWTGRIVGIIKTWFKSRPIRVSPEFLSRFGGVSFTPHMIALAGRADPSAFIAAIRKTSTQSRPLAYTGRSDIELIRADSTDKHAAGTARLTVTNSALIRAVQKINSMLSLVSVDAKYISASMTFNIVTHHYGVYV